MSQAIELNPKTYNQILRNQNFEVLWDNAEYQALGDYSAFHELEPSVTGAEGMPMPAIN